jgi:flagellin-like protein
MKKLLKSRKALSPVVAAIILIAVTVAVSIAVAAWMGALTFTFMKTEELKVIAPPSWSGTAPNYTSCILRVKNSGTADLTVSSVKVNDADATMTSETLEAGQERDITVSGMTFHSGTKYEFAFYTATGNRYPYTASAP